MKHRSALASAIERKDWETVALLLFLGVTRAARRLPPETLQQMIEELSELHPAVRRRPSRGPR